MKSNLNTNLGTRSTRTTISPIIDAIGTKDESIYSCFDISPDQITPGDPFAMTIDLNKEYFIHSVLLAQAMRDGELGSRSTDSLNRKHATQIDVHIGPNPNWRNNPKCTKTPRLASDYKDSIKTWGSD